MDAETEFVYVIALRYAGRLLPDSLREDCACDCRLHLLTDAESLNELRRWKQESPGLLHKAAHNFAIDRLRRYARLREENAGLSGEDSEASVFRTASALEPGPASLLNREMFWQQPAKVCPSLSSRSLHLLRLCYREGMAHVEIAEDAGMTVAAVALTISRSLRAIRKECARQSIDSADRYDYVRDTAILAKPVRKHRSG